MAKKLSTDTQPKKKTRKKKKKETWIVLKEAEAHEKSVTENKKVSSWKDSLDKPEYMLQTLQLGVPWARYDAGRTS